MKFNQFNDITHRPLRIYNRSVLFSNIYEDHGKAFADDYAMSFSSEERIEMAQMIQLVRQIGPKKVKELVTKGLDFPELGEVVND